MKWTSIRRFLPRYSAQFPKPAPILIPAPDSHRYLAPAYERRVSSTWR